MLANLTTTKHQAETARADLVMQSNKLATLQSQQQDQQHTLAEVKVTQQSLQSNALIAEQQLETKAVQDKAQATQVAQKINLLLSMANWGSQIVSGGASSWYYSQIGNFTTLGDSYETVNNVGCLITAIAMTATFYGNRISPDYMATHATFSSEGAYYWGTPSNIGVTLRPSGAVNWGVVQDEISQNRPVLVSIFLPSVGKVNNDGSSHFIVIYGFKDGKYLMQDPIAPGRSYNLNQVRSMVLTRPN
jgi:hypothetical protein